jgi:hypothetical protein
MQTHTDRESLERLFTLELFTKHVKDSKARHDPVQFPDSLLYHLAGYKFEVNPYLLPTPS